MANITGKKQSTFFKLITCRDSKDYVYLIDHIPVTMDLKFKIWSWKFSIVQTLGTLSTLRR